MRLDREVVLHGTLGGQERMRRTPPPDKLEARLRREKLDADVLDVLPPISLALAALYAFYTAAHLLTLPPNLKWTMGAMAAVSSALFLVLWRFINGSPAVLAGRGHVIASGIALVVGANCVVHLGLARDDLLTMNFAFVLIGVGMLFLISRWAVGIGAAIWLSWGLTLWAVDLPATSHWTFAMVTATALAGIVHMARVRHAVGFLTLRGELEQRVQERTAALSSANQSLQAEVMTRQEAERLAQANAALLAFVVDTVPAGISYFGSDDRYRFVNRRFASWFGQAPEEIVGRLWPEVLDRLHLNAIEEGMAKALNGEVVRLEAQLSPVGGAHAPRSIEVRMVPHCSAEGQVEGVIALTSDITELKQSERALRDAQRLESLGSLAGGIAHDFNNLLSAILGNASLIRLEEPLPEPVSESVEAIIQAARQASGLCQQLLAGSGRAAPRLEPLELGTLVREMERLLRVSVRPNTRLEIELASGLQVAAADPTQVRQVLLNLVINAAEAMGDGSGLIRVGVRNFEASPEYLRQCQIGADRPGGDYVTITVSDSGSGIAPEVKARMFEPFFSTKFVGRGLGLASVAGIVRAHGGFVRVDSEPGRGTTFTVGLPETKKRSAVMAAESPAPILLPTAVEGHVLVVDDEAPVRQMTARLLERLGYRVDTTESGREAIDRATGAAISYRAILMDLTMPGLSGLETLRELRKRGVLAPVIVVSGYSQEDVSQKLKDEHGTSFLNKPFGVDALRAALERALRPVAR